MKTTMTMWVAGLALGATLMACGDDGAGPRDTSMLDGDGGDGDTGDLPDAPDDTSDTSDVPDDTSDTSDTSDVPDHTSDTRDASDAPDDTNDASDTRDTADVPDDTRDDADMDDTADGEVIDPGPRACGDFEACDELPDAEGICHGTCRSTDDTLRCRGEVRDDICFNAPPYEAPTEMVDFGDFRVTPIVWPDVAELEERYDVVVELHNDADHTITVPFAWRAPEGFTFEDVSWERVDRFELGINATARLSAKVTPHIATVFSGGRTPFLSLMFGPEDAPSWFELRSLVRFADSEPIACGDSHFPEQWCSGEGCYAQRTFYSTAKCCDGVFFPGAMCCDETDCGPSGACVDGRCVHALPSFIAANTLPLGHQTVRIVLVDSHMQYADDPCADRSAELAAELGLATVEAWYDDLAERRIGRDAVDFAWVVTGGVATSDFLTGSNDTSSYARDLDAWLTAKGCPLFGHSDKIVVASGAVDLLGFGGLYTSDGQITVYAASDPYLLAHELGHSFGAVDLYLEMGGAFLYPRDLMGNYLIGPPLPGDQVAWAEMGYGDIDRNGVVDVVEHAAFPEALAVNAAEAIITDKGALEIGFEIVAREGGVDKRVLVPRVTVRVPVANAEFEQYGSARRKVVVFDGTQVDLAAVEAAGVVELGVKATLGFTDAAWQYTHLDLDETLQVPVRREGAP